MADEKNYTLRFDQFQRRDEIDQLDESELLKRLRNPRLGKIAIGEGVLIDPSTIKAEDLEILGKEKSLNLLRTLYYGAIAQEYGPAVGGKSSSLGVMWKNLTGEGVFVPNGYSSTSDAFWDITALESQKKGKSLKDWIREKTGQLEFTEVKEEKTGKVQWEVKDKELLNQVAADVQKAIMATDVPAKIQEALIQDYRRLNVTEAARILGHAIVDGQKDELIDDIGKDRFVRERQKRDMEAGIKELEKKSGQGYNALVSKEFLGSDAYKGLIKKGIVEETEVAVRSSATAEDLEAASFAGQQATYLHIKGEEGENGLIHNWKRCVASLWEPRAISYRGGTAREIDDENARRRKAKEPLLRTFDPNEVALAVSIQVMIDAGANTRDKEGKLVHVGSAGVAFTIDEVTGNTRVRKVTGNTGLGEAVVGGDVAVDTCLVDPSKIGKKNPHTGEAYNPVVLNKIVDKTKKMVAKKGGGTELIDTEADERQIEILSDENAELLAKWAGIIEEFYNRDGKPTKRMFIVASKRLSDEAEARGEELKGTHTLSVRDLFKTLQNEEGKIDWSNYHLGTYRDNEWAMSGKTGELGIVQSRPETTHSNKSPNIIEQVVIDEGALKKAKVITQGTIASLAAGTGRVRIYNNIEEIWEKERRNKRLFDGGNRPGDTLTGEEKEFIAEKVKTKLFDNGIDNPTEQKKKVDDTIKRADSGKSIRDAVKLDWEDEVFMQGDGLVTAKTDPAWEPYMKRCPFIITEEGGPQSHAAIICRANDIAGIVGAKGARGILESGGTITVYSGKVYAGKVPFKARKINKKDLKPTETKVSGIIATPDEALQYGVLPNKGIGLLRMEMAVGDIGIHPMMLLKLSEVKRDLEKLKNLEKTTTLDQVGDRLQILQRLEILEPSEEEGFALDPRKKESFEKQLKYAIGYVTNAVKDVEEKLGEKYKGKPMKFFVDKLSQNLATIACCFKGDDPENPNDVLLRMSDFKSNEYRGLIGGQLFEPNEENPMIGMRGALRYSNPMYAEAFVKAEIEAVKKVRNNYGQTNLDLMIPFCRNPEELDKVLTMFEENGIHAGDRGLQFFVMGEIPTNALRAHDFLDVFDKHIMKSPYRNELIKNGRVGGFSIGTNDLTQLTLGVDRDGKIKALIDAGTPQDPSVKRLINEMITVCNERGYKIGLCGNIVSDDPAYFGFLNSCGSDKGTENYKYLEGYDGPFKTIKKGMTSVSVFGPRIMDTLQVVGDVEYEAGRKVRLPSELSEAEVALAFGLPPSTTKEKPDTKIRTLETLSPDDVRKVQERMDRFKERGIEDSRVRKRIKSK